MADVDEAFDDEEDACGDVDDREHDEVKEMQVQQEIFIPHTSKPAFMDFIAS